MNDFSKSSQYLQNKSTVPIATPHMAKTVSQYRKEELANLVEAGVFREGSGNGNDINFYQKFNSKTPVGNVSHNGINKFASTTSNYRGSGGTVMQIPELYTPFLLTSNINLPRDRATINAWCRSFFTLNPIVHNAILLHSTYPISKLNIRCKDKKKQQFFEEMNEEIDLMNICVQLAQEFWVLGEGVVYAELNENTAKWNRLIIQNPDYITIKHSVVAGEPIISLRPDENLKNLIKSNKPSDIQQRQKIPQNIIEHVRRNENIPLDNFYTSHIANKIAPYETRGTGLIVSIFKQLMLFDKLRECYSEDTEVLTDQGFKTIDQLVELSDAVDINPNYVNGILTDENGKMSVLKMKEDFKVACHNPETGNIEYHKPIELHMSQYKGKMIHFSGRSINALVSPNHKMWAQKKNRIKGKSGWSEFSKICASNISPTTTYRFQGVSGWEGEKLESVQVLDKNVPIDLYLKFIGYTISEGYLNDKYIDFVQKVDSDCINDMQNTIREFAKIFDVNVYEREVSTKDYKKYGFKKQPSNRWNARINCKKLSQYFKDQIGGEKATSSYKKIPNWIKSLNVNLLKILLETMVLGDGSHVKNKKSLAWKYYTISQQLGDDVQEIVFKCGYAPSISQKMLKSKNTEYCVSWSNAQDGNFPIITPNKKYPPKIIEVNYEGPVWCFEVPTGLFVTRRGGIISIHGNSKFAQADNMVNPLTLIKIGGDNHLPSPADLEGWRQVFEDGQANKDFKIFTHDKVTVEKVGSGQGIYDISGDIQQLIKEIYIGLLVPSVLMDGGADTTYANGGVALDVLRQRYMQFRNMLTVWLRRKIFAPIAEINDYYDYEDGKKVLIVPEVDWNHMSLFDAGDYIQNLAQLTGEPKRVSVQTLYRSLGLDWEDEKRKLKMETIHEAIVAKEKEALLKMPLNQLRTLTEESEIPDPGPEKPVPGESPFTSPPQGGEGEMGPPGGGGLPGMMGGGGPEGAPPGGGPPPGMA